MAGEFGYAFYIDNQVDRLVPGYVHCGDDNLKPIHVQRLAHLIESEIPVVADLDPSGNT
jgi:hypothetical protein